MAVERRQMVGYSSRSGLSRWSYFTRQIRVDGITKITLTLKLPNSRRYVVTLDVCIATTLLFR